MRRTSGFTLIEMTIAIAIIALLSAMLMPAVAGVIQDARVAAAAGITKTVHDAILALVQDTGRSPFQGAGVGSVFTPQLGAFIATPPNDAFYGPQGLNHPNAGLICTAAQAQAAGYQNWRGPYLESFIGMDPWGVGQPNAAKDNRHFYWLRFDYPITSSGTNFTTTRGVAFYTYGPDAISGPAYVPDADDVRQYFVPPQ